MKKIALLFMLLGMSAWLFAQRTVTGTVTGDDGEPLIGASILVKGTGTGTITEVDGTYSLEVPADADTLVISYTGFQSQEIQLGVSNIVDARLVAGQTLEEVVVTALGITRYKNELPYSAQKVDGEDLLNTRDPNVVNTLSGRVAGLQVKTNNNLGGSTNIVLRGSKSLTGDNQALFVIDGVPVDNSTTNTADQRRGRNGYDYGNAANDINPDDIESITVLKGAAASALYGSRGGNGVVLITTKKGRQTKGIGVSVNTGINFGRIDKSTFAEYQTQYGAGYGRFYEDTLQGYFLFRDINGDGADDLVVPMSEDASYGAPFDPNLLVYQWNAFDPTSEFFGQPTPWVAAKNTPVDFFETYRSTNNSVVIDGANERGHFKVGFTRTDDNGILPNSEIDKNLVNFSAGYDLTKKLNILANANYTNISGRGRYGTGYDAKNMMTNFRQWWQVNVDIKEQEEAYKRNLQNVTWNYADPTDLHPIYWDNPYWVRHENFSSDNRDRIFGYLQATFTPVKWLDVTGRIAIDQYDEIQEERINVGSVDVSQYQRFNRSFQETNYDLFATVRTLDLSEQLQFDGLIGGNIRKQEISAIRSSTNGGLILPRLYALRNSSNPLEAPVEDAPALEVDGIFARAGFIFDKWAIVEGTIRRDVSSTLPAGNNSFYYPSVSGGVVISELFGSGDAFSFGKLRLNYAEVGNSAPPFSTIDVFGLGTPFGEAPLAFVSITKNNPDLKPERTRSLEGGLELRFVKDRVGLDFTVYQSNSVDQIFPAPVSRTTGYSFKFINAGEIRNRGVEVQLYFRPFTSETFRWRTEFNFARNRNKVLTLGGEIQNLQLSTHQGGVSINAAVGEPYGTIRGNDFVYDENGNRVVGENGLYLMSPTSDVIIGNINADWTGGWYNQFNFGPLGLSFLVDVRRGGDLFSLDLYYGLATGLYPETVAENDLGNDQRLPIADGGGIILEGVKEDGTVNDTRVSAVNFGLLGYRRNPASAFIYDASFVKLREATIDFNFPGSLFQGNRYIKGATISLYGRNLWIIHKNLPYADPEDGLSAGNIQGYQVGSYPTVRTFGVNLNLRF